MNNSRDDGHDSVGSGSAVWGAPFGNPPPYSTSPNIGDEWRIPFQPAAYSRAYLEYSAELQRIQFGMSTLAPAHNDQRFDDPAWLSNILHRSQLQTYLAYCDFLKDWLSRSELKGMEKMRAEFRLKTILAALSPSNSLYTNPVALRRYRETGGASFSQGLEKYYRDIRDNQGRPVQVDRSKFVLGETVANLAGQVVFRNDMVEVIQYGTSKDTVFSAPMLVCSSVVNKYYLCDLTPTGSLYRFLVDQGFQVFVAVWRNPTATAAHWGLEQYVDELLKAIQVVTEIANNEQPHLTGFCAGAYITLSTLAYLAARDEDKVLSHSIILNAVDTLPEESPFSAMSTREELIASKQRVVERGICTADELTMSFNLLQPDKLYWPYFVKNYLLGESPEDAEVMYWMNDQVNLPAKMFCEFIEISHDNTLANGSLSIHDIPLKLANIDCDSFLLGALKDNIVPWQSVYRTRQLLGGQTKFVLSTGGHITGMITSADDPREACVTNDDRDTDPDRWFDNAVEQARSWRYEWTDYLKTRSKTTKKAPTSFGNTTYPPLLPAPGQFVREIPDEV